MSYSWSNSIDRKGNPRIIKGKNDFSLSLFLLYFFLILKNGESIQVDRPRWSRSVTEIVHERMMMLAHRDILGAVAMACNKRQHFVLVEIINCNKKNELKFFVRL